jgi:cell wall-associated NlpC family hydrolase
VKTEARCQMPEVRPPTPGLRPPASAFFRTEERTAHLLYSAEQWRGTPWCANSAARGQGVSCHNLPRAIYLECAALRDTFPQIIGDPNLSRHSKESAMAKYIDARPEFIRLPASDLWLLSAGDLLGLRIYNCCDHLGVYLGNGVFVHVLMHKNTDFDLIHTPPWQQRIVAAWRPLENPL